MLRMTGLMALAALMAACSGGVPLSSKSSSAAATSTGTSTGTTSTTPSPTTTPSPPSTPPTSVTPLTLQGTPAMTVVAGTAYSFEPTTTPTTPPVTFSIDNQPSWASFDPSTGTLSGTPTTSNVGVTSNITITASNGTTSASIGPFTITVSAPPATPPPAAGTATLNWDAPTQNTDGTPLTDLAGYKIYYGTNAAQLTQQITLNGPSTTYVVNGLTSGTYYFAVTAYTADGTESAQSNVGTKTI
jgi:hypothetical protein